MKVTEKDKQAPRFENPSDGWHTFEIQEMKWQEDESGQATNSVYFPCKVVEDEEEGRTFTVFCHLDRKPGRKTLAQLIVFSGKADVVEKKLKADPDMTLEEFAEKYLNPDDAKFEKRINMIGVTLAECVFRGELETRKSKGKEYQNLITFDYYKQSKGKGGVVVEEEEEEDVF